MSGGSWVNICQTGGMRGLYLVLRAVRARERLSGSATPLRAPKAPSGCYVEKVLEGEQSGEAMVWLTLQS